MGSIPVLSLLSLYSVLIATNSILLSLEALALPLD